MSTGPIIPAGPFAGEVYDPNTIYDFVVEDGMEWPPAGAEASL